MADNLALDSCDLENLHKQIIAHVSAFSVYFNNIKCIFSVFKSTAIQSLLITLTTSHDYIKWHSLYFDYPEQNSLWLSNSNFVQHLGVGAFFYNVFGVLKDYERHTYAMFKIKFIFDDTCCSFITRHDVIEHVCKCVTNQNQKKYIFLNILVDFAEA